MGALSDYLEKALLDHSLANVPYAPPPLHYVSLHTASPGESGTPSGEVAGGSYARAMATFAAATLGAGTTSNTNALAFTSMPAVTVTFVAVYDAATGGNMLYYGALTTAVAVTAGGTFVINAGGMSVALD